MIVRALVAGVVSALLLASAASADTKALANAGDWSAFGGTTTQGTPVCGVSRTADDQYFGLKLFAGEDTFTIQMGTKHWQLVDKVQLKVVMTIDGNPNWNATGIGFHFADGDAGLEFDINKDEVGKFMSEFRNGSRIRIQFQGLPDWTLALNGANQVSDAFIACTRDIK
jgi:hypothetical protein